MLSVGKCGGGGGGGSAADYYIELAEGFGDYYTEASEPPGNWLDLGLDDIELGEFVDADVLRQLMAGFLAGERVRSEKSKVPGFDLTFSSPKSVSVLWGLTADEFTRAVIEDAHYQAVRQAMGYLQREACFTRHRVNGEVVAVEGQGFLAAAFRHGTSRAGDPQLHTHVLVANATRTVAGWWGTLDARQIYAHSKTAGTIYQSALRLVLSNQLGVSWVLRDNGLAEIDGIPAGLLKTFSKRREQITEALDEVGYEGATAANVAALATRKAKTREPYSQARERWTTEAGGFNPEQFLVDQQQSPRPATADRRQLLDEFAGDRGITEHQASFSKQEMVRWFAARGNFTTDQLTQLVDQAIAGGEVVEAVSRASKVGFLRRTDGTLVAADREQRYTTGELLRLEGDVLRFTNNQVETRVNRDAITTALAARPTIGRDQADMINMLTTSTSLVDCVIGKAGTGKTFALDTYREALEASGYRVIGTALAGRAAAELESSAGISSGTLKSLLYRLDNGHLSLDRRTVVVVDEAGMTGTRMLHRLLTHAEQTGTKVVLVGDDRQLPEVEAGGVFRFLAQQQICPTIELTENRRQRNLAEAAALDQLRSGDVNEWIGWAADNGRVHTADDAQHLRAALVADYLGAVQKTGLDDSVMLAYRNEDVQHLNQAVRLTPRGGRVCYAAMPSPRR